MAKECETNAILTKGSMNLWSEMELQRSSWKMSTPEG